MRCFTLAMILSMLLAGCSRSQIFDKESLSVGNDGQLQVGIRVGESECVTPWGETIQSGETRKAFSRQDTGSCSLSCDSYSASLTCENGVLSGGKDFIYDRCDKPKCPCTVDFLPEKPVLKHGDWINLYRSSTVECGTCESALERRQCIDGEISGSAEAVHKSCQSIPCKDCYPDAQTVIPHGSKRDFFKSADGKLCNTAERCSALKLERTCHNGILSGDSLFSKLSCNDKPCACVLGSVQYNHGGAVKYYTQARASCSASYTCASVETTSTCNNGVIAGAPSQAVPACVQESCTCEFTDAAGQKTAIPDGGSLNVFTSSSVGCDRTCTQGTVTCARGVLSGNTSYKHTSCVAESCRCTSPWGNTFVATASTDYASAPQRSFYSVNTSTCGATTCAAMDGIEQKFICLKQNGNTYWADLNGNPVTDFSVYKYASCSDPICSCRVSSLTINQGSARTIYKSNSVACGESCEGSGKSLTIRCGNDLTHSTVPEGLDIDNFITGGYVSSCSMAACPPGTGSAGSSPSVDPGDGDAGAGGGDGGGLGDGNGPGFHFIGRGGGGGAGSPGSSIAIYFLYSLYPMGSGCALPWGGHITHMGSVIAFTQASVTGSQKCSSVRAIRMCVNGVLNGPVGATFLNCTEAP